MNKIIEKEIEYTRKKFNLNKILKTLGTENEMQILRGSDYGFECWINNKCFYSALTPMCAIVGGIEIFIKTNSQ